MSSGPSLQTFAAVWSRTVLKIVLHVCSILCNIFAASEQDDFWAVAKPMMPTSGDFQACMKAARQAAREYLRKAPKES